MRNPEVAGSKCSRGTRESRPRHSENLYQTNLDDGETSMISSLSTTSYYNFLSGTMIALFVVALIIIFVYEYEVLRRSKTTTTAATVS
jgi:ABC-type siderophore export system fused ATPase/permease subunit